MVYFYMVLRGTCTQKYYTGFDHKTGIWNVEEIMSSICYSSAVLCAQMFKTGVLSMYYYRLTVIVTFFSLIVTFH